MSRILIALLLGTAAPLALAKLPPPSDEAKAKAADAAAKTAHANKVAAFQLCRSMDRVAARYLADAAKSGKTTKPTDTPACVDPGPFGAPAAAPAAPAVPAAKKT